MLTKKTFELLAESLSSAKPGDSMVALLAWEKTVRTIAERLFVENPKFVSARFYKAADYMDYRSRT